MIAQVYIELFRNIPTLQWMLFFYFVFPELLPGSISSVLNNYKHYNFIAAVLGIALSNAAYVAEILRSGIEAIPVSQVEAAISLGLSKFDRWRYIILPQTVRIIFPPLMTRMIHNLKNTSLALAVTVNEITWTTQQIESLTFRGIEVTTTATLFFVILNAIFATLANIVERVCFKERKLTPGKKCPEPSKSYV